MLELDFEHRRPRPVATTPGIGKREPVFRRGIRTDGATLTE